MNYIYIAKNNKQEVKIGVTKNIQQRMKQLSGTNTLDTFVCIYCYQSIYAYDLEEHIHKVFSQKYNRLKEFFDISPEQSVIEVKDIIRTFEYNKKEKIYDIRVSEGIKEVEETFVDDLDPEDFDNTPFYEEMIEYIDEQNEKNNRQDS